MNKRILSVVMMILLAMTMLAACGQEEEAQYTEDMMNQAYNSVGFPDVSNYFERQQLKEIYELRDDPNLICYWYTKSDMTGKWIYQGECIGYGIPYTASITANESLQKIKTTIGYSWEVVPLAEPNGLYSAPSTSATWILETDKGGNITPTYVESEITVSQNKIDVGLCEEWSIPENY